jgi:hypothetical protein
LSSYGKFCSVDLVVVLWKSLFHGLGCRPMENFVPWTWLSSYGKVFPFGYHRLGCRLMDACMYMCFFFAIDLIVVLWKFPFPWTWLLPLGGFLVSWTWLSSYERFSVPWTWLSSHGRIFVPMDLIVVLRKILGFD